VTDLSFYKNKKVFVTGHNGFKGSWLCNTLLRAGADVSAYSLAAPQDAPLFAQTGPVREIRSTEGDIRDREHLARALKEAKPEIIFHLAAQPLVRAAYREPAETYETNVMGTVNILQAVRETPSVRSFVNVTTDKVYQNREWCWGYRENEKLCGFDPYSNSKSCSELVTYSYRVSFFNEKNTKEAPALSTARAGNVIGGGDYADDRILPDCVRAAIAGKPVVLRNPHSVRPYQHVLDCLSGYLLLAEKQYSAPETAGEYNFGPDEKGCVSNSEIAGLFCAAWGDGMSWEAAPGSAGQPHEAVFLKLDCSKANSVLGWAPRWDIKTAVAKTVEFAKESGQAGRISCVERQIKEYFG
jgi:CDP-glucose 4,6-dehydratase